MYHIGIIDTNGNKPGSTRRNKLLKTATLKKGASSVSLRPKFSKLLIGTYDQKVARLS